MIEQSGELYIETEDDAWTILLLLVNDQLDPDVVPIRFSKADWMGVHFNYRGRDLNQTLTPSLMSGVVEYQRFLYQVIALATKGEAKASRLTDKEKKTFELVFKVDKGSTDLAAKAQEIIEAISGKVFDNMTSTHKMICILIIAVFFFGYMGFETYLENNLEIQKVVTQQKKDDALAEIIKQMAPNPDQRAALIEDAAKKVPAVKEIKEKSDDAYDNIVRSAGGVDQLTIQGLSIDSQTVQSLTQITRRSAEKVTIKGRFTVSNVDTKVAGGFLVRFEEVGGTRVITANLADAILAERYKKVIERATFSKKVIQVTISARKIGDNFLDAKVLKASTPLERKAKP